MVVKVDVLPRNMIVNSRGGKISMYFFHKATVITRHIISISTAKTLTTHEAKSKQKQKSMMQKLIYSLRPKKHVIL